jgi:site-specific DNA-methyltransferase (adenine-specific)
MNNAKKNITPQLLQGDMLELLPSMAENSIHAVVCDPPYHLSSIVKRFGGDGAAPAKHGTDGLYARSSRGFMGKTWDGGDVAFCSETWRKVFRVMKPGAYLVAFGGTRTFHRMAVAIEDAGFELRDTLMWLYGTGFPKSHNQKGDWEGWGSALKPGWEPIILAQKTRAGTIAANLLSYGCGALNIDACRVPHEGTHGLGRWPANLLHDGSDEVEAAFAEFGERPGQSGATSIANKLKTNVIFGKIKHDPIQHAPREDSGTASRFFYSTKATKADRANSKHPTVKPVLLMRWLVRLVVPPEGTVLDPFAGSGTTGAAAMEEGRSCILVERDQQYCSDILNRFNYNIAGEENEI